MQAHHYLVALPKIGHTLWHGASWHGEWVALLSFSAAAAATLCGMRGYKAIGLWAKDLGWKARARFRCYYRNQRYEVPSRTVIREVLTRVDSDPLDRARWFGTPSMPPPTKHLPSTVRRCAMLWMNRGGKPTSWG